ncbi:MAG: endo-1,4-beta-xylanase [Chitinophagales bacterium]
MIKQQQQWILLLTIFLLQSACSTQSDSAKETTTPTASTSTASSQTLKDAFKGKFYIGTALNSDEINGSDTSALKVIKKHMNSIVAENCMKSESLQPKEGEFTFAEADAFVEYGEKNGHFIIGHTLVWHQQTPDWLFKNADGTQVSKEVLTERMRTHITTIVSRYKGRVDGWDVVNEAISDEGGFRDSEWHKIIGDDFIKLAFEFAHAADPDAKLYYNDYSMSLPPKREGVIKMVKRLQEQAVQIDGIGMQGHSSLDFPNLEDFEASIVAFSELDVKVMVTELDISVLPFPEGGESADVSLTGEFKAEYDPYDKGLSYDVAFNFNKRYLDLFTIFLKHSEKIERITFWGVDDGQSWRNYWPIKGRTDYPLLFDRDYRAKPVVEEIIFMAGQGNE